MFELFTEKPTADNIFISAKNYPDIKDETLKSINKVLNHYRDSTFFVNNDHFLVRLIKSLPYPNNDDVRSWYYRIQDLADGLGEIFDIITYQNSKAKVQHNVLLGGVGEIFVEYNLPITMNYRVEDWLNTSPITFLYHPYLELRVRPLDGKSFEVPKRGDFAVIGIDIPLLYVQYWLWRKNIVPKKYKDGNYPSLANWVYQYPLVTAIKSFIDYSMLNRYLEVIEGNELPVSKEVSKLDTHYIDYTRTIDEFIISQVNLLRSQKRNYPEILKNLPLLLKSSAYERLRLNSGSVVRQLRWCYFASRVDIITLLLELGDIKINGSDRYYDEKWKYGLRAIQSEYINTFPTTMGLQQKVRKLSEVLSKK